MIITDGDISSSFYPIGLLMPFTDGNNGYFAQSFDTNTQIKQNLTNFINTRPGERRMAPTFGTKLYGLLFNQLDKSSIEIAKNIIATELQQWIPQISITNISINNTQNLNDVDNYKIEVSVYYVVIQTQTQNNITFSVQNVNI